MIISASRRTDIPAFYGSWFLKRIEAGYVTVKNPFNPAQERKVNLSPENVDAFVFWTKNPEPFIPELQKLKDYSFYFLYTITPYGVDIEPFAPEWKQRIETFKKLSDTMGPGRVILRYDPIILTGDYSETYHYMKFEELAKQVAGYTDRCVFSFAEWYAKCLHNMQGISYRKPAVDEMRLIAARLAAIASKYDMTIQSCAMPFNFSEQGAPPSGCIDAKLIHTISGNEILSKPDPNQRKFCLCNQSIDIGAYNTCIHGCKYCYANHSYPKALERYRRHDADADFLS